MPYAPAVMTSSNLTDTPAGTISTTIQDSGAVFDQANTNAFRSSAISRFNALRTAAINARSTRGGGYRPVSGVGSITLEVASTGTTIPQAQAAYLEANEEEARGNLADQFNKLLTDIAFVTGPVAALTALTISSGGSVTNATGNPGATHSQGNSNNYRTTLSTKLNLFETAIGA